MIEMTRDFNYNIAPQSINTARTIQALQKTADGAVSLPLAYNKNLTAVKNLYEGNSGELTPITGDTGNKTAAEMAEEVKKAAGERKKAEEAKKKEALLEAKTEFEADRQEFRDLSEKLDDKWRDELGGSWDVSEGSKVKEKVAQMEAKKEEALNNHDEKIEELKEEKSSLETKLEGTKDDQEKKKIEKKITDVDEKIEKEEANKAETERQEEEKIKEKKENLQKLKDRLYELREESIKYKEDLERSKSYEDSPYWKDDIKRKQEHINLEVLEIEREVAELTRL
ncbi:MAG: hypothetical protein ABRQ38_10365 [Candidatus Eremiobacterota bacterium]